MKLGRTTPAQVFEINTPVWGGRKVGLATYKIGIHNEVRILYTHSGSTERVYPQPLYISGKKARTYPTQPVKSNPHVILHIIPINDLEVLERVNDSQN